MVLSDPPLRFVFNTHVEQKLFLLSIFDIFLGGPWPLSNPGTESELLAISGLDGSVGPTAEIRV